MYIGPPIRTNATTAAKCFKKVVPPYECPTSGATNSVVNCKTPSNFYIYLSYFECKCDIILKIYFRRDDINFITNNRYPFNFNTKTMQSLTDVMTVGILCLSFQYFIT